MTQVTPGISPGPVAQGQVMPWLEAPASGGEGGCKLRITLLCLSLRVLLLNGLLLKQGAGFVIRAPPSYVWLNIKFKYQHPCRGNDLCHLGVAAP